MNNSEKKLFLIDAMALIYRAYFALNKSPRINSKGLNTSAILGFANTLNEIIKSENPTHIAVAFDSQAPTIRHDNFANYKANRQITPEDIIKSIPYVERLVNAWNIPALTLDGYEADDIIGTIAKQASNKGFITYIVTSDKDFGQLVSDNIFIYKLGRMGDKAEIWGVKEVCNKFNINNPSQIIDILGLWGDATDNIPGIPGIGEVKAKQLIAEFGTIENLLANVNSLQGKIKENIINFSSQALLSKQLATIILDAPIEFNENKFLLSKPNIKELKELFDELEFKSLAKRIFTNIDTAPPKDYKINEQTSNLFDNDNLNDTNTNNLKTIYNTPHKYHLISTHEEIKKLSEILKQHDIICFDTETTNLNTSDCELVGISFCIKPGEAWFIEVPENYYEACKIVNEFKDIFESKTILKVGQNIKFDISVLRWYDIDVNEPLFDTMIAHYLLQPDNRHNMDYLAETYLNYKPIPITNLIGEKDKKPNKIRNVDKELLKEYACEDADITLQLKNTFVPLLEQNNLTDIFYKIEMPLVKVLASMENEGVKIDANALNEFSKQINQEIKSLEQIIYSQAGTIFNISSPKQLGEILFDKLKISEKPKQTKTKQFSTNEEVLKKLVNKHPIINNIMEYRSLTKLKSTYVDILPTLISPRTGQIHTSYNQAVASTGRLSSNNPNLQNIPVRTEKGKEIRKAFVPRNENYLLLSADYSQIELRIMASLSGDKAMCEAFGKNLDIHADTAAKVYNVPISQVTPEMRRRAKTINFGIIYGISAYGLSERLTIPKKEAAEIIEQYFKQYPGIKEYMENIIKFARKNGYVQTILGRRRYIRDINSANNTIRGFAERNAINAPIQGSAADMIKIAMNNIFYEFKKLSLKTKMIMQVHDELVFDAHINEIDIIKPIIKGKMTSALLLNVPVEVDIKIGKNWLEAH
ncbi:MAG TPA: DNA polymerase I [Bacteroidales bacterium]|nr:DNA polymerase I [Bacteroidales bacterium]